MTILHTINSFPYSRPAGVNVSCNDEQPFYVVLNTINHCLFSRPVGVNVLCNDHQPFYVVLHTIINIPDLLVSLCHVMIISLHTLLVLHTIIVHIPDLLVVSMCRAMIISCSMTIEYNQFCQFSRHVGVVKFCIQHNTHCYRTNFQNCLSHCVG